MISKQTWNERYESLIGKVFNRLTVISSYAPDKHKKRRWVCLCRCGKEKIAHTQQLKNGKLFSCGCFQKEMASKFNSTHGKSKTCEYHTWQDIKDRCYNQKNTAYKRYGGRGIGVSDRWRNSFENFIEDMGTRPSKEYSLDRYPNNESGWYEKDNCRWATEIEQQANRRDNIWIEYNKEKMILSEWARKLNISHTTINYYLKRGESFGFVFNRFNHKIK